MVFQSENRYRLCPFWSGNNSYEETTGVINIFVVSFQVNYANLKWILRDLFVGLQMIA